MNQNKIGKKIANLRKQKGLTQAMLASKIGVTSKAISRWECDIGMPDVSLLTSLSDTLGITIDELLNDRHNDSKTTIFKNKLFIMCSGILFILLSLLLILYIMYFYNIYPKNYLEGLFNNIMLIPFNNIIILLTDDISLFKTNLIWISRNILINLLLGIIINSYLLFFKHDKRDYYKLVILTNILLELFKWIILHGTFDIDDIIIRFILAILIYKIYERKNKDV